MLRLKLGIVGLAAAALLASCSTGPQMAAPAPAAPQASPYRWTQGNAPQAQRDALALFGAVPMKPGAYYWASAIPADVSA